MTLEEQQGVRLAIEGCGHGTLHAIYASVAESCKQKGWPGVDLVIIGGDFQAVRNAYDLNCVSMPAKYREMGDFHEYYSGKRTAPYLTIFVGGNHEASNHLTELYFGGWVAPQIYYMGAANIVKLGPLRIAGMSGIWKGFDYRKPHFERLPYNDSDMKSVYHIREMDVRKLMQVNTQVDIGISHDWPQGIEWKGDWKRLFRHKKHFEDDAKSGRLGSVAAKQVLDHLRPSYWFSAHLHCKFAAVVQHQGSAPQTNSTSDASHNDDEIELDGSDAPKMVSTVVANEDEIDLDLEEDAPTPLKEDTNRDHEAGQPDNDFLMKARAALPVAFSTKAPPACHIMNPSTQFLALDKCLPNRDFLQLLEINGPEDASTASLHRPLSLEYDREWLAIVRTFARHEPQVFGDPNARVTPARTPAQYREIVDIELQWVNQALQDHDLSIPNNFNILAPEYDGGNFREPRFQQSSGEMREYPNSQTASFCSLLQIPNPLEISEDEISQRAKEGPRPDSYENGQHRGFNRRGRGRGDSRGFGRGSQRGFFRGT